MLVEERMSHPVLTIDPSVPVADALERMRRDKVTRYPVVDKKNKLVGIVTKSDLMNARPSEATSLSVWEINTLLARITVERVMSKEVLTVEADETIEEAARIMADHDVSGLVVMRSGRMVGLITQTDLFHIFLEVMGARTAGVRITMEVPDLPGEMYKLTKVITELGGDIKGLGAIQGEYTGVMFLTMKITGASLESLRDGLAPLVSKVVDIREEKSA